MKDFFCGLGSLTEEDFGLPNRTDEERDLFPLVGVVGLFAPFEEGVETVSLFIVAVDL